MAKDVTLIHVLVSSPEELTAERQAVRRIAEELNNSILSDLNIRLEVITWQTHGSPDFASDAQEVLNRQLADWDIYIGMLGNTFGTPTPRAGSGTEEEFVHAYKRWKDDQRSCRIMFYFSDAPVAPSRVNLQELSIVRTFREKLGELGGLYWSYRDATELPELLRRHILSAIKDYGKTWGPTTLGPVLQQPRIEQFLLRQQESGGILDLAADAEDASESFVASLDRMTTGIAQMGQNLGERTQELQALTARGSVSPRKARTIARAAAEAVRAMGATVDRELPVYRQSWSAFRESVLLLLSTSKVESRKDKEELQTLLGQLTQLRQNIRESLASGNEMRQSLDQLGLLSRDLRAAVRDAGTSLATLFTEIGYIDAQVDELERTVRAKVGSTGDSD